MVLRDISWIFPGASVKKMLPLFVLALSLSRRRELSVQPERRSAKTRKMQ